MSRIRPAKITVYLSEGEHAFLRPDNAAFQHDEVVIDFTIVGETSLQGQETEKREVKREKEGWMKTIQGEMFFTTLYNLSF